MSTFNASQSSMGYISDDATVDRLTVQTINNQPVPYVVIAEANITATRAASTVNMTVLGTTTPAKVPAGFKISHAFIREALAPVGAGDISISLPGTTSSPVVIQAAAVYNSFTEAATFATFVNPIAADVIDRTPTFTNSAELTAGRIIMYMYCYPDVTTD